ncbi:hypothetical protein DM860_011220 [Cuscuta australis]|uniref:NAC domain-containing protein n=1 Tax=Cuscuta australis TaxID=267555 RepID=A0A328DP82_9ASTE|nr:hypothetical protein DM860_011220 [Cuscuta australis]
MGAYEKVECERVVEKEEEGEEEECTVLPGFRFHPTDEELVGFYLTRKVENKPISIEIIKQVDIYKYDPWDLPRTTSTLAGDNVKEWYFFCIRGRKYKNSVRPNRVTSSGFWKATGIDKPVYAPPGETPIGLKKSLVFYRGNAGKGIKTDWMMHEFRLAPPPLPASSNKKFAQDQAEIWTLCRVFKRNTTYKRCNTTSTTNQEPKRAKKNHNNNSNSESFLKISAQEEKRSLQQFFLTNNSGQQLENVPILPSQPSYYCPSMTSLLSSSSSSPTNNYYYESNNNNINTNVDERQYLFTDQKWDELKSVVDLATTDPFPFTLNSDRFYFTAS